jgi:hypothetical protein
MSDLTVGKGYPFVREERTPEYLASPPQERQPDPEESIRRTKLGTLDGSLLDEKLMPQREVV